MEHPRNHEIRSETRTEITLLYESISIINHLQTIATLKGWILLSRVKFRLDQRLHRLWNITKEF